MEARRERAGGERAVSCQRASEIDLLGYLDEPRRPEFAEFRTHYPGCRECAAEVRAWTELRAALRAGGAASHPAPELLARYEESPGRLASAERRSLEAHLASCAACRDELRALRAYSQPPRAGRAPAPALVAGRGTRWLAALRRLLWNPALAYALLAAFIAPTLYLQVAGRPSAVEPAGPPTAAAPAEAEAGVRRLRPAPARERAAGAAAAKLGASGSAPAAAAEAGRSLASGRVASAQAPPPPAPEPMRYAPPRAASRPPAAAARTQEQEYAAGRAAPVLGAAVAELAAAPAPALALREGEIPKLSAAAARAGLRLLVTVPEPDAREMGATEIQKPSGASAGAGDIEVRVVAPGGARELRERHRSDRSATIDVPPGWLVPGRYEVALHRVGAGLVTDAARYAFDVEQETGLER